MDPVKGLLGFEGARHTAGSAAGIQLAPYNVLHSHMASVLHGSQMTLEKASGRQASSKKVTYINFIQGFIIGTCKDDGFGSQ